MISIKSESYALYQLRTSTHASFVVDTPSFIHGQLGHPSFAKLQHNVSLVNYANIVSCSSFTSSVPTRTLSPFALVHSNMWDSSCVHSF